MTRFSFFALKTTTVQAQTQVQRDTHTHTQQHAQRKKKQCKGKTVQVQLLRSVWKGPEIYLKDLVYPPQRLCHAKGAAVCRVTPLNHVA